MKGLENAIRNLNSLDTGTGFRAGYVDGEHHFPGPE